MTWYNILHNISERNWGSAWLRSTPALLQCPAVYCTHHSLSVSEIKNLNHSYGLDICWYDIYTETACDLFPQWEKEI